LKDWLPKNRWLNSRLTRSVVEQLAPRPRSKTESGGDSAVVTSHSSGAVVLPRRRSLL
jgi:hypothetical protein